MIQYGFGAMRLPLNDEDDFCSVDIGETQKMIDSYMDAGYNFFDTAYPYHNGVSETTLKECLVKKYPRESFILMNKLPSFVLDKKEDMERIFNEQLDRCGVDYFDYYLLHNVSTWTLDALRKFDAYEFIKKLKDEGKVKHIGISLHDNAEILEEVLKEMPDIEVILLQINYLDWENDSVQSKKCYELARKYDKDIIVMEPLKGGNLIDIPKKAEKLLKNQDPNISIPGWGFKFAASLDGVKVVLSGASNLKQIQENIQSMKNFKQITDEEKKTLFKVGEIIKDSLAIPCTQCNYCIEECPNGIPISKFFELYNLEKRLPSNQFSTQQLYYRTYAMKTAEASDCDACGDCVEKCPQHLDIPGYMEDIVDLFHDENY